MTLYNLDWTLDISRKTYQTVSCMKKPTSTKFKMTKTREKPIKVESINFIDSLFELSPDALILVDDKGTIKKVNEQLSAMFGYSPSEVHGEKIEFLMPERFRDKHPEQRGEYMKNPKVRQMGAGIELYGLKKEGAVEFPLDIMLSPIDTPDGNFVLASIRDLTERRKLDEELSITAAKFRTLFDNTYQFIGLVSIDGLLLEANKASLNFIGVDAQEVLNKYFWDTPWWSWSEKSRLKLKQALASAKKGEFVRYETVLPDKDGQKKTLDFSLKPVFDHEGNAFVLVAEARDITEQKMAERQREDFVATLTHDLKTPILAANRALNLLVDGDFGDLAGSQKEIIETILESNDAMYQMVLTLLDVYKYDSGLKKLSINPIDLAEVISKLIEELKPLADSKGIKLEADLPKSCIVMADKEELRRLLQNLLDNSLKYTPTGMSIKTHVEQGNDTTTVSVVDTGKGISEDDKPKLFQRFWQAADSGRYYASTGLGLYLCRQIVESHRGQIWCESELGKGSTFSFSIPNLRD